MRGPVPGKDIDRTAQDAIDFGQEIANKHVTLGASQNIAVTVCAAANHVRLKARGGRELDVGLGDHFATS